ncbi:Kinectin [Frankliniella fusca]|uniref:Kinectin n=1 Tax=Frankliniella fusca TaxID=407009 RepID=A0AAE1L8E0_9NEOP|nr:Kinectin [Frankliniella fusca]KAK3917601.1 Kinectin [Frankliniella fusca]
MKWIHVQMGNDRVDCPASYIEGYVEGITEIEEKSNHWVFWRPSEEDTPKKVLSRQRKLIHVTPAVLRKNNGEVIAGYYECTILLVRDSEDDLMEALKTKRVSVPRQKISPRTFYNNSGKGARDVSEDKIPVESDKGVAIKRKKTAARKLTLSGYDEKESPPSKKQKIQSKVQCDGSRTVAVSKISTNSEDGAQVQVGTKQSLEQDTGTAEKATEPVIETKSDKVAKFDEGTKSDKVMEKKAKEGDEKTPSKLDLEKSLSDMEKEFTDEDNQSSTSSELEGLSSDESDVPKAVLQDVVDQLKEVQSTKKNVKKRLHDKLENLRKQLEESETKLKLEREQKRRLEGELLREHIRSQTGLKFLNKGTKDSGEVDVSPNTSKSSKESPSVETTFPLKGENENPVNSESKRQSNTTNGKSLSKSLVVKREALVKKLSKEKKAPTSVRRSLFSEEDWKDEEWVFSKEQKKALGKTIRKGHAYDGRYVKKAIDLMWDREDLYERSAKGLPGFNQKVARPECTPLKKAYLSNLLKERALSEGDSAENAEKRADLENLEKILSSKISTVRRDINKEKEKKAEDEAEDEDEENTVDDDGLGLASGGSDNEQNI